MYKIFQVEYLQYLTDDTNFYLDFRNDVRRVKFY